MRRKGIWVVRETGRPLGNIVKGVSEEAHLSESKSSLSREASTEALHAGSRVLQEQRTQMPRVRNKVRGAAEPALGKSARSWS